MDFCTAEEGAMNVPQTGSRFRDSATGTGGLRVCDPEPAVFEDPVKSEKALAISPIIDRSALMAMTAPTNKRMVRNSTRYFFLGAGGAFFF